MEEQADNETGSGSIETLPVLGRIVQPVAQTPTKALAGRSLHSSSDLLISRRARRERRSGGLGKLEYGVMFAGDAVGVFDSAEARGDPGLAVGDGLAVETAVRAVGQVAA